MHAVTVSEGSAPDGARTAGTTSSRARGSTPISDVCRLGAEEDNRSLDAAPCSARATFDAATDVSEERRSMSYEELLIAEGSDWCWWYGPEHDSANPHRVRPALSQPSGERVPVSWAVAAGTAIAPDPANGRARRAGRAEGPIHAVIDGEVTSYFEWLGAGLYRVDERSGSMQRI